MNQFARQSSSRPKDRNQLKSQLQTAYRNAELRQAVVGVDGVDYINTSVSASTELGILLAPDFECEFTVRYFGQVSCLQALLAFCKVTPPNFSLLKKDYEAAFNVTNSIGTGNPLFDTSLGIAVVLWERIRSDVRVLDAIRQTELPFEHFRHTPNGGCVRDSLTVLYARALNFIAEAVRKGNVPDLRHFASKELIERLFDAKRHRTTEQWNAMLFDVVFQHQRRALGTISKAPRVEEYRVPKKPAEQKKKPREPRVQNETPAEELATAAIPADQLNQEKIVSFPDRRPGITNADPQTMTSVAAPRGPSVVRVTSVPMPTVAPTPIMEPTDPVDHQPV